MIFPPSEINLGLNTGGRYTPCAQVSLSHTPKQFLTLKGHSWTCCQVFCEDLLPDEVREPLSLDTRLCVGLMTYLEHLCFFEGQPQKPSGPVSHCSWLGVLKCLWMGLARCFEGVLGNTPSCRVGTISSRVTKDNLEGSGRSSPEPFWHPRPPFS